MDPYRMCERLNENPASWRDLTDNDIVRCIEHMLSPTKVLESMIAADPQRAVDALAAVSADKACLSVVRLLFMRPEDRDDYAPRSMTPEQFVRLLSFIPFPSEYGCVTIRGGFYTVQKWLDLWLRQPVADVAAALRLFDTVPWMPIQKGDMRMSYAYPNQRYTEAVLRWCLPVWRAKPDYIESLLRSELTKWTGHDYIDLFVYDEGLLAGAAKVLRDNAKEAWYVPAGYFIEHLRRRREHWDHPERWHPKSRDETARRRADILAFYR